MPPACADCGAPLRPGVVWFGEPLPRAALEQAAAAAAQQKAAQAAQQKAAEAAKKKESEAAKKKDEPEVPDFAQALQDSMGQTMKIMMYVFPIFPLVGAFMFNFPLAIGIYFLLNNVWTAVQSHFFMERLEKELPMSSREGLPPSAFM